jgi:hypothetical protein
MEKAKQRDENEKKSSKVCVRVSIVSLLSSFFSFFFSLTGSFPFAYQSGDANFLAIVVALRHLDGHAEDGVRTRGEVVHVGAAVVAAS